MSIVDAAERHEAIDPLHSFCVGAPAGSGKTELLIQRYLCLLARVERPEQVLAITFTRKAAAQMRERVVAALVAADEGGTCESAHEEVTRNLALEALRQNERKGWQIARDVSRFNIKTIDSFCAGLVRQMPVLSQLGGSSGGQDDATEFYAEAVLSLFEHLDSGGPIAGDLRALMAHFDNDWARLQSLLISMLARREQWRDYVGLQHAAAEAEAYLFNAVDSVVTDELESLAAMLVPYRAELLVLMEYAADNLKNAAPDDFPAPLPAALKDWRFLRSMLLTKDGGWRKQVTKREGFPAGKGEPEVYKSRMKGLLAELQTVAGLGEALAAIVYLPEQSADGDSWRLVVHLSRLLPMLAAELLLVFQRRAVVDHTQVTQSALLALGDDEEPTDLALRLDYRIEHILVDEFQDTAITQYELLHKLTRGWGEHNEQHPHAPRTLMVVGDAMQSIYGFRGANVGLFLKARQEGFNGVLLKYLQLKSNFRSDAGVVNWVNATFVAAFPAEDDIHRSQVCYSPAEAVRPAGHDGAVQCHGFSGEQAREEELQFVLDRIAQGAAKGEEIAVLGRSRSHLQPILDGLKARGISHNAQDLGSLANSALAADLLTLCRALANEADRLSWMSLLRAPWCGLTLADLLVIARHGERAAYGSVLQAMGDKHCIGMLSADGAERVSRTLPVLRWALNKRDRLGLRVLIESTWLALGGPECAAEPVALEDVESFFQLLERADAEGLGLDPGWLRIQLEKQFMAGGDTDACVQLMTLHKSKGLEFEHVIIPMLDRGTRGDGRDILLWDEFSAAGRERRFLLAADDHCEDGEPTLYNFLRQRLKGKRLLENTRVLYVGVTRAVSQLLLTASLVVDEKTEEYRRPNRQSLLQPMWSSFEQQMQVHCNSATDPEPPRGAGHLHFWRLAMHDPHSLSAISHVEEFDGNDGGSQILDAYHDNYRERRVGTVVHQALEELSLKDVLPERPAEADYLRWRDALRYEGLHGQELERAFEDVQKAIHMSLDPANMGRWILSDRHRDCHSEWALTAVDKTGVARDLVIDRCFIERESNVRWIIDYKNSCPSPQEALSDFLARETENYQDQLTRYRDSLRGLEPNPQRCALFFTALGYLHEVAELSQDALSTTAGSE